MKVKKFFNLPLIFLIIFPFYFAYDLYSSNLFYSHDAYAGVYFPFRKWFLNRLMNLEFSLWNPFWGAGHPAVMWSTIPIDPNIIFEIFINSHYEYFFLIHTMAIVMAGYYVFRKWDSPPLIAVTGSLFFFMSPVVNYWSLQFVNTSTFIAHMFTFLFMVKWFETRKLCYVFLMGWTFFLGMFGTKLEFWFFEAVYFVILLVIISFIMKPKKHYMIFIAFSSIIVAIAAHAWQINLLIRALNNSRRLAMPHGLHNLFSLEMYRNLYLSLSDSNLIPLIVIIIILFIGLNGKPKHRWLFLGTGVVISLLFKFWEFSFLSVFLKSPILYGALVATITVIKKYPKRYLVSTWILFMLPAYYWCNPMVDFDETYLLGMAPIMFKWIWGFLAWLGCQQVHRQKTAQIAFISIIIIMVMETQGQIFMAYLFGYVWMVGRDTYLIDFSFSVVAVSGMRTLSHYNPGASFGNVIIRLRYYILPLSPYNPRASFRNIIIRLRYYILLLSPFIIVFSFFPNLLHVLPRKPTPPYANTLLYPKLSYNPFESIPGIKNIISKWDYLPYRRVIDPDIDIKSPINHGTFLLEQTGNAALHESMKPTRFVNLINFVGHKIDHKDNLVSYPSVYSKTTISRLPKGNTNGLPNGLLYYLSQWSIPPLELDILRMLGVDHIITRNKDLLASSVKKLNLVDVKNLGEFNVATLSDTLPRAFLVTNVTEEKLRDFKENMEPNIKMYDKVKVDQFCSSDYVVRPSAFLTYNPEYVSIEAESSEGGYLVLTDVFHPYWSAKVDGNPVEIIPAFHTFRGVKVPGGSHEVEFFCKVPHFKTAFFVSIFLVIASSLFTFRYWRKELL
ncbi:MAG: hypothetical protein GY928_40425 [Colwellia sp.]|nr:hypothetical protein [Colwellia sp.]